MKTKAEIKELISNDKLKEAIEEIKFITRSANEALQLSGRLAGALKTKRLGQISDGDHEIAINKISSAMLNYVDSIDDSQFPQETTHVQKVQSVPEIPPPINTVIETTKPMSHSSNSKLDILRAYRRAFLNQIKKIEFDTDFKTAREKAQKVADSIKDYVDKLEVDPNYDFNDIIYKKIKSKKDKWIENYATPIKNRDLAVYVETINAINKLVDNMDGDILIDALDEMIFMGIYSDQFKEFKDSAERANKTNNLRQLGRIAQQTRDLIELAQTKL